VLPQGGAIDSLAISLIVPFDGRRIFERLPDELWPVLAPTAVADRLSRRVKAAFDPERVLNPGVLGDEE
jgi:FAD/FMN-containing dehydrogenase